MNLYKVSAEKLDSDKSEQLRQHLCAYCRKAKLPEKNQKSVNFNVGIIYESAYINQWVSSTGENVVLLGDDQSSGRMQVASFLLGWLFEPDDGGDVSLRTT
jgi:hypothetical protein